MGVYGEISHFFVGSTDILKRWHTLWKFKLQITSNKKVIAKKHLTNLYEMNSTYKKQTQTGGHLKQVEQSSI